MIQPPSTYRRKFPQWAPDLIQCFVPLEELHLPERFTQPPIKPIPRRKPHFDPFY
jgi:hypothetical protein